MGGINIIFFLLGLILGNTSSGPDHPTGRIRQRLLGFQTAATGRATITYSAQIAQLLLGFQTAAAAALKVVGDGAQTLVGFSQALAARLVVQAAIGMTLLGVSTAAAAKSIVRSSIGQTLLGFLTSAEGNTHAPIVTVTGAIDQLLVGFLQAMSAHTTIRAAVAQTLLGISQSATARTVVRATAAQTLLGVTQAAEGGVPSSFSFVAGGIMTAAGTLDIAAAGAQTGDVMIMLGLYNGTMVPVGGGVTGSWAGTNFNWYAGAGGYTGTFAWKKLTGTTSVTQTGSFYDILWLIYRGPNSAARVAFSRSEVTGNGNVTFPTPDPSAVASVILAHQQQVASISGMPSGWTSRVASAGPQNVFYHIVADVAPAQSGSKGVSGTFSTDTGVHAIELRS